MFAFRQYQIKLSLCTVYDSIIIHKNNLSISLVASLPTLLTWLHIKRSGQETHGTEYWSRLGYHMLPIAHVCILWKDVKPLYTGVAGQIRHQSPPESAVLVDILLLRFPRSSRPLVSYLTGCSVILNGGQIHIESVIKDFENIMQNGKNIIA